MKHNIVLFFYIAAFAFIAFYFIACSKPDTNSSDPCADKTIVVSGTVNPTSGGTATNGTINASASGSSGFTYNLNGGSFQAGSTFTGLATGTYTIVAKDNNGCVGSQSFTVTASPCPAIVITGSVIAASSTTATNGSITVAATGSTGITFSLNNGPFQSSGSFTGLAAGPYSVTAKDMNGCTSSAAFVVTGGSCPTITISATTTAASGPTATNGSITATANGGVAPYTYSKDAGVTFQSSGVFNNLAVANYSIVAKDANGCLGASGNITVSSAPCPTITVTSNTVSSDKCSNNTGSVTVTASGSSGLMFNLNGGAFQSSSLFPSLAAGSYTVSVRDANGCTATVTAQVNIAAAGPNFANVKAIMIANCALSGCHAGSSPQNGINLGDDCTIVSQAARIKARAVDGNPSIMPPSGSISASDKQKIVDWINAGGKHSN
jgi:SprB repeat